MGTLILAPKAISLIWQGFDLYIVHMLRGKFSLTELDAAIGDADHGINMQRGFKKVIEKLPAVTVQDIGTILKTVSITLISTVGGASGPLYGTFFLRASTTVAGKQELDFVFLILLCGTR